MRQLILDSASEACTAALMGGGQLLDYRHEVIGRGHAERLVPLIAELDGGGRADEILIGCGPGSFAGVRIGVAAGRGLALGWGAKVRGFSSLALVAAGAKAQLVQAGRGLVVMEGGHGQWFVQPFDGDLNPLADLQSMVPDDAIALDYDLMIGNRAEAYVELKGAGQALAMVPDARHAGQLPPHLLFDDPSPIYGRAPDAKPAAAKTVAAK